MTNTIEATKEKSMQLTEVEATYISTLMLTHILNGNDKEMVDKIGKANIFKLLTKIDEDSYASMTAQEQDDNVAELMLKFMNYLEI